ncbi:MAG: MMPL family transporter [Anaerolineae bacterium]|nr:MMPL family transporter [Anaerolineae bacterium]
MFEVLGRFATHYRIPILAAWIALAVIVTLIAPNINDVASSDQADFLPANAPFVHANDVYKQAFPESFAPGSSVVVIDMRESGGLPLTASGSVDITSPAGKLIKDFEDWLNSADKPANVSTVVAPTSSDMAVPLLVSADHQVAIVRVSLTTSGTEAVTQTTLQTIDEWLVKHAPERVKTYQTGESPIINNTVESIQISVDRTIWVTIVLVIVMLLLVYRSPVSPIIPLLAVTVAYFITRGIVAYIGAHYLTITSYTNVLLVVVLYGAGTDYCLFLISRFREEMADQQGVQVATKNTVQLVGETITSSAGTIFVGFVAMAFSEMGIFSSSGPALAIGIVIGLLAGLTFTPALLAVLGERAFWPSHAKHRDGGRFYEMTSKWVSAQPLITIIVIVGLLLPFSVYGLQQSVNYSMLSDLPTNTSAVNGYNLLSESLGSGNMLPLSVVITGRDPIKVAAEITDLTAELAGMHGVADVRSLNSPLGQHSTTLKDLLRVDSQLTLALSLLDGNTGDAQISLQDAQPLITGLKDYFAQIAQQFPQVASDPNLVSIQNALDNPLSLLLGRDNFIKAVNGLAARFSPTASEPIPDPYLAPSALRKVLAALPDTYTKQMMMQMLSSYLTEAGTAYKLDVVFAGSPISYEAMDTLKNIRALLQRYSSADGDGVASGGTALVTDIRDTIDRDMLRTIGLVLLGIFVVLLLLLRSLVAPLYLIATVLLSFTCTLGITNFVFKEVWHVEGLTWYVPFFMFVFLVALGMDYSIFVFGRIKEEVANHGMRDGVHVAVARTGSIITSAGMILAGTFAALVAGEIKGLQEVGFAVAVGVLIDTFIVRTILVPALATLFGRWTWWPSHVPQKPAAMMPSKSA